MERRADRTPRGAVARGSRAVADCLRVARLATIPIAAAIAFANLGPPAFAQRGPGPGATLIEGARVEIGDGTALDDASVLIVNGRIEAVGKSVRAPNGVPVIDGKGKVVTPGLIDAESSLGMTPTVPGNSVVSRAADSFDPYASADLEDALRNGVTTAFLSVRGAAGMNGVGALVKLKPRRDGGIGEIVDPKAALCLDLGSGEPAIRRIKVFQAARKQLKAAQDYRSALESYADDLKEYETKLKERAAKDAPKDGAKPEAKDGAPPAAPPAQPAAPPAPAKDAPKDGAKDELKKPQQPPRSPDNELLLELLDRKLRLRVRCDRDADVENALALGREFDLALCLVGAGAAWRFRDDAGSELAKSGAPIILVRTDALDDRSRRAIETPLEDNPRTLERLDVPFAVGSGAQEGRAARFVLMQAQAAARRSGGAVDPIALVTLSAAKALDVADATGSIARGKAADVVLWSGDPRDPSSRPMKVWVDGEVAFTAEGTP